MKNKRETESKKEIGKVRETGKIRTTRKASKMTAALSGMALAIMMLSGCGKSDAVVEEPEVISVDTPQRDTAEEDNGTQQPEGGSEKDAQQNADAQNGKEQNNNSQTDPEAENENKEPETESNGNSVNTETGDAQESDKLIGKIKSIGDNNIVISRSFEEASNVLVAPADGSPDEVLVTISVSDATTYEVKTVKNGGVNGDADVENSEGSFSDCEENVNIDAYGSYEGNVFHAVKIIIYHFV